jgi:hypothetical protein
MNPTRFGNKTFFTSHRAVLTPLPARNTEVDLMWIRVPLITGALILKRKDESITHV